jgi:hypothetical protein
VSPQVLGVVACRVTSTILGIGSAERSWGAVKHLKTNKRSHLGGETTRMQATVFGAACIEKSRVLKVDKEKRMELWNDNDVEFQIGLENWRQEDASPDDATERNPRRLFRAWKEDWELESAHKNDAVHEAKLLRKYAGLKWIDPDTELMFVAEGGKTWNDAAVSDGVLLHWTRTGKWNHGQSICYPVSSRRQSRSTISMLKSSIFRRLKRSSVGCIERESDKRVLQRVNENARY